MDHKGNLREDLKIDQFTEEKIKKMIEKAVEDSIEANVVIMTAMGQDKVINCVY